MTNEIETITNILDEMIVYEAKFRKRREAQEAQARLDKLREEHRRDEAWQLRYEERVEANPRVDEEDQDENE